MIALNLDATTPEHIILKDYLEQNASEALAEKINNGVPITKDGKKLISKKTLDSFWNYAGSEAQKLAEKSARVKAVEHTTVFNWAIHYFEENSLEGKLFNEDGTEYTPPKPVRTATKTSGYQGTTSAPIAVKPKPMSFFDLVDAPSAAATKEPLELSEAEQEAAEDEDDLFDEKPNKSPVPPPLIRIDETKCVDEDGVVHAIPKAEAPAPKPETPKAEAPKPESAEPKIPDVLIKLFGSTLVVR